MNFHCCHSPGAVGGTETIAEMFKIRSAGPIFSANVGSYFCNTHLRNLDLSGSRPVARSLTIFLSRILWIENILTALISQVP